MSNFFDLVQALDQACLDTFDSLSGTVYFPNGTTVPFTGLTRNPAFEDDYVPGSQAGVGMLILFIRIDAYQSAFGNLISLGCIATINGVSYDIFEVNVDRLSGATLKMRRRKG